MERTQIDKLNLREAIEDFLAQPTIAIAGVSRTDKTAPGNLIFDKLSKAGHLVYAVNPHALKIQGETCYPDLYSLPRLPDGVIITTHPDRAFDIIKACIERGISRVWMHRSFGKGSVSEEAVAYGRSHGLTVIAGACPMMYYAPVDFPHKCMRGILSLTGGLPKMD